MPGGNPFTVELVPHNVEAKYFGIDLPFSSLY